MKKMYEFFKNTVIDKFQFLVDEFSFDILESKDEISGIFQVLYFSKTTGIKVTYEQQDNLVFVFLIKLKDGRIPDNLYAENPINSFYLDSLIYFKDSSMSLDQKKFNYPFTQTDFEKILDYYSYNLKKYGEDILKGNFTIFKELEKAL